MWRHKLVSIEPKTQKQLDFFYFDAVHKLILVVKNISSIDSKILGSFFERNVDDGNTDENASTFFVKRYIFLFL